MSKCWPVDAYSASPDGMPAIRPFQASHVNVNIPDSNLLLYSKTLKKKKGQSPMYELHAVRGFFR